MHSVHLFHWGSVKEAVGNNTHFIYGQLHNDDWDKVKEWQGRGKAQESTESIKNKKKKNRKKKRKKKNKNKIMAKAGQEILWSASALDAVCWKALQRTSYDWSAPAHRLAILTDGRQIMAILSVWTAGSLLFKMPFHATQEDLSL